MSESCLTVSQLLKEDYIIPLYQRNFAWTYDEIEQLIVDVADACVEKKDAYYIGTLVVDADNKIIDGQQRTTALTLIALALKEYDSDRIHLTFEARRESKKTLKKLLEYAKKSNEEVNFDSSNELSIGFNNAVRALKKVVDDEKKLNRGDLANYLFYNVKIFKTELANDLDLNLYFERFNSRGEQLQAHEIIKAQMMDVLKDNEDEAQKFARIWEICSQMDKAVILSFKHKSKPKDESLECEKIFSDYYDDYQLKDIYNKMETTEIGRHKLVDYLKSDKMGTEGGQENDLSTDLPTYRSLVNFETFLFYAFYITENESSENITLDDKKLLATFEEKLRGLKDDKKHDWVIKFSENLLRLRFIFDNFIIQNTYEDNKRDEINWTLKKVTRQDKNNKKYGRIYIAINFEINTFSDLNTEIIQLQSMFAVTFTSNRDTKWLYKTMSYLFKNSEKLSDENFSKKFKDFLEKLAVEFAEERIYIENKRVKSYQDNISVYAFNFIDYILWTKRNDKSFEGVFSNANQFKFKYRQSIEHWYPQNPNESENDLKKIDDENLLHSIGNLCITTQRQNSQFSNLPPKSKASWKNDFSDQSLKLQWMKHITDDSDWSETQIKNMKREIEQIVNEFIESVK